MGLASSYAFTDRELEVLREMTGGDTNQEIAERLHMSVATGQDAHPEYAGKDWL